MMNNILCKIGRIGLTDLSRCGLYSSYFYCLRYASSKVNVCRLTNRKIISLSGHDSYKFLQGLITNDVRCLYLPSPSDSQHKSPQDCLFAFVLYPNGRVLADTLIYDFEKTLETNPEDDDGEVSSKSQGSLYIECDDRICERLIKYFKSYKLRKNVTFDRDNSHDIWSLFSAEPTESIESNICQKDGDFIITSDPRLRGHFRILAKQTVPMEHLRETLENKHGLSVSEVSQDDYILHRYRLGIGEGFDDHPDAKCLPLECNVDFLNGINFQKGCYIGQELTARTYHTGVIRKRLVPIQLINPSANDVNNFLDKDFFSTINDKKLGKIRSIHHSHGLGLTYIENLSDEGPIRAYCKSNNSENLELDVFKPTWWPK